MSLNEEESKLIELLFPNGFPGNNQTNETVLNYLSKLKNFKIDDLIKEPVHLQEERNNIQEQTQTLAVANYKTFIESASCSRELFKQFNSIESKLENVVNAIPKFEGKCEEFTEKTSGVNNLRKLNSLTLTRNAQLLEILELPQLMNSFINDGLFEDALELASYVRKLFNKHPDIPIFKSIVDDVDQAWLLMLRQLLLQLKQDLALPKCLEIVGHLRRMEVFSEAELRLKFLQARNSYLQNCLNSIPKDNPNHHVTKLIETTRVNLFNIITQYRAIFNDDEHGPLAEIHQENVNQNLIFYSWINEKLFDFLEALEEDLNQGVSSIDTILGQCMYFGLSFSKVGCDFRSYLIPIFENIISKTFKTSIQKALRKFDENMEKFTLINKNFGNIPVKPRKEDPVQPPDSLLEFYPLADFLNNVLNALNQLRLCAPISIIDIIVKTLQDALVYISKSLLILYNQEQQAFTANSKEAFSRLCLCFANDLVNHIQKCVHLIFPPSNLASHLGVNMQILQENSISFLNKSLVTEPIKHLLPSRTELDGNETEQIVNDQ